MADEPAAQPSPSSSDQVSSLDLSNNQSQVPVPGGLKSPNGNIPTFPIMYPMLVPGLFSPPQDQEQTNRGPGLYAVPVLPYMQPMSGYPSNTLIPFTYDMPTQRSSSETRTAGGEQGQAGEQRQPQQGGPQRQVVVRRFQIAIQFDLLLILKLAAVIFLFNQDGSRQRLIALVLFASLIYLCQTGALDPVIRWLTQGMQGAALPPQRPRLAVRADNVPAAARQENENMGIPGGQPHGRNENQQNNDGNGGIEEVGQGEADSRWWRVAKEIKMIVFGFITSLLPGFHNIE